MDKRILGRSGISILCSMALQQGLLTGLYQSADQVPMNQAHSRHYHNDRGLGTSRHGGAGAEAEMFSALPKLRDVANDLGITLAQMAIAWTISRDGVASSLVGSRTVRELEDNVRAAALILPESAIAQIDAISLPVWRALGDNPDYYESDDNSRIY